MKTILTAIACAGLGLVAGHYAFLRPVAPAPAAHATIARDRQPARTDGRSAGATQPARAPESPGLAADLSASGESPKNEGKGGTPGAAPTAQFKQFAFGEIKRKKINELEVDYKPFFDRLRPEMATAVRALLVSRLDVIDLVQAEAARGATRDEQNAKGQAYLQQVDGQLKETLGDDYQGYTDFTKALPYVKAVEKINDRFYLENASLNADQKSAILQALISTPKPVAMADVLAGKITKQEYLDSVEGASQSFTAETAKFLTPKQQTILVAQETNDRSWLAARVDAMVSARNSSPRPPQ